MISIACAECGVVCVRAACLVAVDPACSRDLRDGRLDVEHRVGTRRILDFVHRAIAIVVDRVAEFRADLGVVLDRIANGPGRTIADIRTRRPARALCSRSSIVAGTRLVVVRDVLVQLTVTVIVEGVADFVVG